MRRRLTAAAVLVALLPLVACGGGDDEEARTTDRDRPTTSVPDPGGSSPTTPSTTEAPGDDEGGGAGDTDDPPGPDAGETLIVLDVHGGFVPYERAVADTAEVVIRGDGTVVSPALVPAIYPGPALLTFQVGRVAVAEVADLVDAVAGLDPDADYEMTSPMVADAPDTTVRLRRAGTTVELTAYAIGYGDDTGPRAELAAVVDRIRALADGTGDELYSVSALRIHDITEHAGVPPDPGPADPAEPQGRVLDWPVPHGGQACTVVTDREPVEAILDVLGEATQLDWFRTDAGVRRLLVVPVLPGDEGCDRA